MTAEKRQEFEQLVEVNGGIVAPETLFESARKPDSAFHDDFVWDVNEAAYKHNIELARGLIRKFTIVRNEVRVREFHSVSIERAQVPARAYATVDAVRANVDWKEEVAARLIKNMRAAMRDLAAVLGQKAMEAEVKAAVNELRATTTRKASVEVTMEAVV